MDETRAEEDTWLQNNNMPNDECSLEIAKARVRTILQSDNQRVAVRIQEGGFKAFAVCANDGPPLNHDRLSHFLQIFEDGFWSVALR